MVTWFVNGLIPFQHFIMSLKSKKKSIWHNCEVCLARFPLKDLPVHRKESCPPAYEKWIHPYFKEKTLHTTVEGIDETGTKDMLQLFPKDELADIVLLSREVLRLGRWNVGDPVIVVMKGRPIVKTVWPFKAKSLMGARMLRENIEGTWGVCRGQVTIKSLSTLPPSAKQVIVTAKTTKIERQLDSEHVVSLLRGLYSGKYLFCGTKFWLPFYGKKLLVNVKSIAVDSDNIGDVTLESSSGEILDTTDIPEKSIAEIKIYASTPKQQSEPSSRSTFLERETSLQCSNLDDFGSVGDKSRSSHGVSLSFEVSMKELENDLSQLSLSSQAQPGEFDSLCAVTDTTEFVLDVESDEDQTTDKDITTHPDIHLCGCSTLRKKIVHFLSQAMGSRSVSQLKKQKGILLYGPPGTGKTQLIRVLARELNINLCEMQSADVYSKFLGETESRIKEFFDEAKSQGPAVILLDKIDWLSSSNLNTSGATDLGRRAIETLALNLDSLQESDVDIAVIATACSLDMVDSTLRRSGRLECEEEMPLPDPIIRLEILNSLLAKSPHSLSTEELLSISNCTHGFVGGDIISLGSHAFLHMSKSNRAAISYEDFTWALTRVSPSAMKEVQVNIPNVRWTDIAGQENLKLRLRQSVEWPLTHPEAFLRLGIRPPRGILMYGPPGCSKTMIAKAVATESKLNFISIKGSELFSKWVGESERAVREVFRRARQVAPSIVFFDELDAIGGERFTSGGGTRNVESRVLTQLLTEMDGVEDLEKVIVVGATNRPDRIDKALLRPGRMDNIVYVPLPDDETRKEILRRQFKKMPVDFTNLDKLVKYTFGYSGAEVVAVCHEAGRKALTEDVSARVVREDHFNLALKEVKPRTPASLLKLYEDYQKLRM